MAWGRGGWGPPDRRGAGGGEEPPPRRPPGRAGGRAPPLAPPPVGARRIEPRHRLPVGLHELPGEAAPVDAAEHGPDHVGRVLAADLAVARPLERSLEELRLPEAGEGVEVALLLLRAPRALEALGELPVLRLAPARGENGDDGRHDVGVERRLVLPVAGVELPGPGLDRRIVPEDALGAEEVPPELTLELGLAGRRRPAEALDRRAEAGPDDGGETGPHRLVDHTVHVREGARHDTPDVGVGLVAEARGEVEEVRGGEPPGPGKVDEVAQEIEALDRLEGDEARGEPVPERPGVGDPVETR